MVRCKFKCVSKTEYEGWGSNPPPIFYSYKFQAVTSGSKENEQFYASTPSGTLEVSVVRSDLFTPGKEYYLDVSDAG